MRLLAIVLIVLALCTVVTPSNAFAYGERYCSEYDPENCVCYTHDEPIWCGWYICGWYPVYEPC